MKRFMTRGHQFKNESMVQMSEFMTKFNFRKINSIKVSHLYLHFNTY